MSSSFTKNLNYSMKKTDTVVGKSTSAGRSSDKVGKVDKVSDRVSDKVDKVSRTSTEEVNMVQVVEVEPDNHVVNNTDNNVQSDNTDVSTLVKQSKVKPKTLDHPIPTTGLKPLSNKPKLVKKATKKQSAKPTKKNNKVKKTASKGSKNVRALSKNKKAVLSKDTKVKRVRNYDAEPDPRGIWMGPARVKTVLQVKSLNPDEYEVRRKLMEAENKPKLKKTPEQVKDNSVEQGHQTPISELDEDVQTVVKRAEQEYEKSLREAYEKDKVKKMDNVKLKHKVQKVVEVEGKEVTETEMLSDHDYYLHCRSKASEKKSDDFDLYSFNMEYDKSFYNGYAQYKKDHDSYAIGSARIDTKTGKLRGEYTQWTRAMALVNKLCTRLSGNTRNIIACFLDNLVIQYSRNGIHNCLLEKRGIVLLSHALTQTEGFETRVPLDKFVKTFDNYQNALDWIYVCREVKERNKQNKATKNDPEKMPVYPFVKYEYEFDGYVGGVFKMVKAQMAREQKTEAEKNLYLDINVNKQFKKFCSYIVYEAILRIGSCLREAVKCLGVKTISDNIVFYTIKQIHNVCGMDFTKNEEKLAIHGMSMEQRLSKFAKWKVTRKEQRKEKRKMRVEKDNNTVQNDSTGKVDEEVEFEEDEVDGSDDTDEEVEFEDETTD